MNDWQHLDHTNGLIFPWYTEAFLHVLRTWNISDWVVGEFGAGASTLWWRDKVKELISVDNNPDWAAKSGAILAETEEEYLKALGDEACYDCIIIDGEWRNACGPVAMKVIKRGGIVILDNSDRDDYSKIHNLFKYNERHSYPQQNHPEWRTCYWVVIKKTECVFSHAEAAADQRRRKCES